MYQVVVKNYLTQITKIQITKLNKNQPGQRADKQTPLERVHLFRKIKNWGIVARRAAENGKWNQQKLTELEGPKVIPLLWDSLTKQTASCVRAWLCATLFLQYCAEETLLSYSFGPTLLLEDSLSNLTPEANYHAKTTIPVGQ